MTSLVSQTVKHLPATRETRVRFLGREDPLEEEMAICSSILAWKIPNTKKFCLSMEIWRTAFYGIQRVGRG